MLVAAIFSRRCATEEVPGMSRIVAECCSSQASATCRGDAPSRGATASSTADCSVSAEQLTEARSLPPQLREDGERLRDRVGSGTLQTTDAQVDHVESLQPEMLEMQAETGVLPKVLLTARSLA